MLKKRASKEFCAWESPESFVLQRTPFPLRDFTVLIGESPYRITTAPLIASSISQPGTSEFQMQLYNTPSVARLDLPAHRRHTLLLKPIPCVKGCHHYYHWSPSAEHTDQAPAWKTFATWMRTSSVPLMPHGLLLSQALFWITVVDWSCSHNIKIFGAGVTATHNGVFLGQVTMGKQALPLYDRWS